MAHTYKFTDAGAFDKEVASFTKRNKQERRRMHDLLFSGLGFIERNFNTSPLSKLISATGQLRMHNTTGILAWVYAAMGGYTGKQDKDGLPIVDMDAAIVRWSEKDQVLKLKALTTPKTDKAGRKAEEEKRKAAIQAGLAYCASHPFYEFNTAKVKNPYHIQSLVSAIKKAHKELESEALTAQQREFIADIHERAKAAGFEVE